MVVAVFEQPVVVLVTVYPIVAVPAVPGVTVPNKLSIVQTILLSLLQIPFPVASLRLLVPEPQEIVLPVIAATVGNALIVTVNFVIAVVVPSST